jgi:SAM-dependent methyltransferase
LLGLPGSLRILDVGCGTGDDARQMAALVNGTGRIVGVDNSLAMIAVAQERAAGQRLAVEFQVAEALALPFDAASFDGCRADRSLMHVPDPRLALSEMVRVTTPGGKVVVYEVDFETIVIDTPERTLARRIVNTWCDGFRDGWLGRRIPALLRELGLRELSIIPHTLVLTPALALPLLGETTVAKAVVRGVITPVDGQNWLAHLAELQKSSRFFSTLTGFLVAGTK